MAGPLAQASKINVFDFCRAEYENKEHDEKCPSARFHSLDVVHNHKNSSESLGSQMFCTAPWLIFCLLASHVLE